MPCKLFLLFIPLWRQFGHTVVHLKISRFYYPFRLRSEMKISLWILPFPNFDARVFCFVFWRKFPSERKNAFHGHCGLSHLLKVSLCWRVGGIGSVELQELSWSNHWTAILQYFLLQPLPFLCRLLLLYLSFRGGLVDRCFFCGEWMDNSVPFDMFLFWRICNAVGASNHTLDHDYKVPRSCCLLLLEGCHSSSSFISGSFSAPFSEQCLADMMSIRSSGCRLSHLRLVQVLQNMLIQIITWCQ